jgi:hypothetical protein
MAARRRATKVQRGPLLDRTIKSLRHIAAMCDGAFQNPAVSAELREIADAWEKLRVQRRHELSVPKSLAPAAEGRNTEE